MIRSMTGYGNAEKITKRYHIKVEIKSLNGKFLELNLRTPKLLGEKEPVLRKFLSTKLIRGSVLCILSMDREDDVVAGSKLNTALAKHYHQQIKSLSDELGTDDKDILRSILMMPEVMTSEDGSLEDSDWDDILEAVNEAYDKFDSFRLNEGSELRSMLLDHNTVISAQIPLIEQFEETRKQQVKDRLAFGLEEYTNKDKTVDLNRFEQELIYYLEKLDIAEEKNRLKTHCELFDKEINKGSNGKKLGFISQEMGREINTLGSKAGFAPIQELVIVMKEELEKIKEQTLNVL
ncbi:MAG: hypothetical protein ACI9JN_002420 [Bacteroidia bacterium]|jgi:uncharacterized protein (TIGR00255 family)